MKKAILGIQVGGRSDTALELQRILTEYGCYIKTRVGVHDTDPSKKICSEMGIILLDFVVGEDEKLAEFEEALEKIDGIVVKKMEFDM
ncbi:MAG: Iron-only hydrogenase system regulator [Sporanaerobacter sp.]|jgi:hypothetical protein|uniref:hypothetical protein n=1 Tax=Sporanaerobacter sp. TaxID=2010183 RepID=UPI003A1021F0